MSDQIAYLVDFDGTVTARDITSELAAFYGGTTYMAIEMSYRKREIPIQVWLKQIAALLPADLEQLQARVEQWSDLRRGFSTFLNYTAEKERPVIIASDGFGFYIEPILKAAGLSDLVTAIYRNEMKVEQKKITIANPHAHQSCPICGNCKAAHVIRLKEAGYAVIYIGDGSNDRFGASWADHICARDQLAESCRQNDFKHSQWIDFYDIIKVKNPLLQDRTAEALCLPMGKGIKVEPV